MTVKTESPNTGDIVSDPFGIQQSLFQALIKQNYFKAVVGFDEIGRKLVL